MFLTNSSSLTVLWLKKRLTVASQHWTIVCCQSLHVHVCNSMLLLLCPIHARKLSGVRSYFGYLREHDLLSHTCISHWKFSALIDFVLWSRLVNQTIRFVSSWALFTLRKHQPTVYKLLEPWQLKRNHSSDFQRKWSPRTTTWLCSQISKNSPSVARKSSMWRWEHFHCWTWKGKKYARTIIVSLFVRPKNWCRQDFFSFSRFCVFEWGRGQGCY